MAGKERKYKRVMEKPLSEYGGSAVGYIGKITKRNGEIRIVEKIFTGGGEGITEIDIRRDAEGRLHDFNAREVTFEKASGDRSRIRKFLTGY